MAMTPEEFEEMNAQLGPMDLDAVDELVKLFDSKLKRQQYKEIPALQYNQKRLEITVPITEHYLLDDCFFKRAKEVEKRYMNAKWYCASLVFHHEDGKYVLTLSYNKDALKNKSETKSFVEMAKG